MCCVMYTVNIFFIGKAYYFFRNTGGLKGNPGEIENILPEWLEDTVVVAAKKVGSELDKNLDKAVAKDKKDDKEAAEFNKEVKKVKKEKKPVVDSGKWK